MHYRELPPPDPLRSALECVWHVSGSGRAVVGAERILPDGCPELILNLGDPIRERRRNARESTQPRLVFVGPLTSSFTIEPRGVVDVWGIRFKPGGASILVGDAIDQVADRSWALDDIVPRAAKAVASREPGERPRALLAELARLEETPSRTHGFVDEAVAALLGSAGRTSIDALARRLLVSRRTLERHFQRRVGMGPKRFARIVRFQNLLRQLHRDSRRTRPDWAGLALDCGYVDQAHLSRDFTALAGSPPGRFLLEHHDLSDFFTDPKRLDRLFSHAPRR